MATFSWVTHPHARVEELDRYLAPRSSHPPWETPLPLGCVEISYRVNLTPAEQSHAEQLREKYGYVPLEFPGCTSIEARKFLRALITRNLTPLFAIEEPEPGLLRPLVVTRSGLALPLYFPSEVTRWLRDYFHPNIFGDALFLTDDPLVILALSQSELPGTLMVQHKGVLGYRGEEPIINYHNLSGIEAIKLEPLIFDKETSRHTEQQLVSWLLTHGAQIVAQYPLESPYIYYRRPKDAVWREDDIFSEIAQSMK